MVLEIRRTETDSGEEVTDWEGALRNHQGDGNHLQGGCVVTCLCRAPAVDLRLIYVKQYWTYALPQFLKFEKIKFFILKHNKENDRIILSPLPKWFGKNQLSNACSMTHRQPQE